MKKTLMTFLVAVALAGSAFAQTPTAQSGSGSAANQSGGTAAGFCIRYCIGTHRE